VGFFDDLRLPQSGAEPDEPATPEWWAAPEDHVPGVVPAELVLATGDDAAVFITRIAAYPQGFEFDAELLTREAMPRDYGVVDHFEVIDDADRPQGEIPPHVVRLGIGFSDGRRISSVGTMLDGSSTSLIGASDDEEPPDPEQQILMTPSGGSGSLRRSTQTYWVWPLPPPGPLTFACEWPAFGIEDTTVEIDADVIREAAARARSVWA
jgi:hypothetical protein